MRFILNAKYDTRARKVLDKLNFLSVKQRVQLNMIKMFNKIRQGQCLSESLIKNKDFKLAHSELDCGKTL